MQSILLFIIFAIMVPIEVYIFFQIADFTARTILISLWLIQLTIGIVYLISIIEVIKAKKTLEIVRRRGL